MKINCKCGRMAIWQYMPKGQPSYCDACVPRGCGCNFFPITQKDGSLNYDDLVWEEWLDEDGRQFPCCEYEECLDGFEQPEITDV